MKSNHDAFIEFAENVATMYMRRNRNNFVTYNQNDFYNTLGFAMQLQPDEKKIKEGASGDVIYFKQADLDKIKVVTDAIKNVGGYNPSMIIYPIVLEIFDGEIYNNCVVLPIFCVSYKDKVGYTYIDINGRLYKDQDDFIKFDCFPPGKMAYPDGFHFKENKKGNAQVSWCKTEAACMPHKLAKVADWTTVCVGIGCGILGLTGVGLPIAIAGGIACGGYGITRSAVTLIDRGLHGQSLNPFSDWESFAAWTGVCTTMLGFGCALSAMHLSEKVSQLAQEGLRISRSTAFALNTSILLPHCINGGLMTVQLYQMVINWERMPTTQKIMIGLQFLFFLGATYKIPSLTVNGIKQRVAEHTYQQMREILANEPMGTEKVEVFNKILEQINGKYNREVIQFFRKVINYDNAVIFALTGDGKIAGFGTLEIVHEGNEVLFKIDESFQIGPESLMQLREEMQLALKNDPNSKIRGTIRMPSAPPQSQSDITSKSNINPSLRSALEDRGYTSIERIRENQKWLSRQFNVPVLESVKINDMPLFQNMSMHDQIRLISLEDIHKSLNETLSQLCLKYAQEQKVQTIGQFVSQYEICSMELHKRANNLRKEIKIYQDNNSCTILDAAKHFGVNIMKDVESVITYDNLPTASTLFAKKTNLKMQMNNVVNNIGKQLLSSWEASTPAPSQNTPTLPSISRDVQTLAKDVIKLGNLSFETSQHQIINSSQNISFYKNVDANFPTKFLNDANSTIRSCKGHIQQRVVEVTLPNTNIRRLAFWNLEDNKYAKCTVVCIDENGKCRIQNFSLKKIKTVRSVEISLKDAILKHLGDTINYNELKAEVEGICTRIGNLCKDYVGAQLIRGGENHDVTLSDLQGLSNIRFASLEHAVCHVLKHGDNLTDEQIVSAIRNYFQTAQEVIRHSIDNPECVSSKWTQTGSARDFIFYRKLPGNEGVEKVIILVRETGEVIMKTYFLDLNIQEVPPQTKHLEISMLDVSDADLQTFYFHLMLITPRYGVLLPNKFKVYDLTEMENVDMQRSIIITASHYIKKDSVDAEALCKAINSSFPVEGNKWQVFALKNGYNFFVDQVKNKLFYGQIADWDFVIYVNEPKVTENKNRTDARNKYKKSPNYGKVDKSQSTNPEMEDIACRICSEYRNYDRPTGQIRSAMNECFDGPWNCFKVKTYHYYVYRNEFLHIIVGNDGYVLFN